MDSTKPERTTWATTGASYKDTRCSVTAAILLRPRRPARRPARPGPSGRHRPRRSMRNCRTGQLEVRSVDNLGGDGLGRGARLACPRGNRAGRALRRGGGLRGGRASALDHGGGGDRSLGRRATGRPDVVLDGGGNGPRLTATSGQGDDGGALGVVCGLADRRDGALTEGHGAAGLGKQVLGGLLVADALDQLLSTHGQPGVGLPCLAGSLGALAANLCGDLLDLLGDLLEALDGPVLDRTDVQIQANPSCTIAGLAQPLDRQVGGAEGGVDGSGVGDGLSDVLDEGHDLFSLLDDCWVLFSSGVS